MRAKAFIIQNNENKSNIKALILLKKEYFCNIFLDCTLVFHLIFLKILQNDKEKMSVTKLQRSRLHLHIKNKKNIMGKFAQS